eukprot:TRINITY_DN43446_c0_g1_i1.p1 TRINITY_DN43446_c0_g1~~TRINITY_DN43446_c0_g1_i1.p1  ORF type:complete len:694 (+),score=169.40 TRINITY_DN43446_c0_g1_i1:144-2225(+)
MPPRSGAPQRRKTGCPSEIRNPATSRSYSIGEVLGKGGFGIVRLATDMETGVKYAAKIMDMEIVRRDGLLDYIERETKLVRQLSHPHIIKFLEVMDCEDYGLRFYIMELASNGELFDQIVAVSRFSERTARRYFQQFVSGVRYCHSQGVVHRDLKAENLLLDNDNRLKICDFGLSRYCFEEALPQHDRQVMFTSVAGSLDYQAPEILRHCAYHGKPADIWACGVILVFMVSGWLPFQDHHSDEMTRQRILSKPPKYKVHPECSPEVKDLIKKCLVVEPSARITADEIIRHPWFQVGLDAQRCHQLKIPERLLGAGRESAAEPIASPLEQMGGDAIPGVQRSMLNELRVAFDTIDVDKSGFIKHEELRDVLIKVASAQDGAAAGEAWVPSHEDVQGLIRFFDTAGDGRISFQEFVVGFVEKEVEHNHTLGTRFGLRDLIDKLSHHGVLSYDPRDETMKEYIETFREAFNDIDEDKTGVIREQELHNLVRRAGIEATHEEVDALFRSMDTGKQRFITFEEFVNAWMKWQADGDGIEAEPGSPSANGLRLLGRLRKCKELIMVSEQDEARRTLSHATTLGLSMKGDVGEVVQTLQTALETKTREGPLSLVLVQDLQQGQTSASLRLLCSASQSQCECSCDVAPLLEGYSRLSVRRLTGKTTNFHRFYLAFEAAMKELEAYTQCAADLREQGPTAYV